MVNAISVGNNEIRGTLGADTLLGTLGPESIIGFDGNDTIVGFDGNDSLFGGNGADTLFGDPGNDYLNGEVGNDFIAGYTGADTLIGGDGADTLFGWEGNDYLNGEAGNDVLDGEAGNDSLFGGDGADSLQGWFGNDSLNGEVGNDFIGGGTGNDSLFGGDGADILLGWEGNDYLNGEAGNDVLDGEAGNDSLFGGDGNDTLIGGDDPKNAYDGSDYLDGGVGNDAILGMFGNNTLIGGDGADSLFGGAYKDSISGDRGDDILFGGNGDDTLNGGFDNDFLSGGYGNDVIDGGDGADTLISSANNDSLSGGAGNDIIISFAGLDTLSGGLGADTLAVNIQSVATITDFSRLDGDRIVFEGNKNGYRLELNLNSNNPSQLETAIYYENNLTAVVKGTEITWDDIIISNQIVMFGDTSGQFIVPERWLTHRGGFWETPKLLSGDFNGDGSDDLAIGFNDTGAASIDVAVSDGSSFTPKRWLSKGGGFWETQKWLSGDFNGDGLDDLAIGFNDGGGASIDVEISTGSGFTPQRWLTHGGGFWDRQKWLSGDFNGDGLDDIAIGFNDAGAASIDVEVSTGAGFTPQRWMTQQGVFADDREWLSGDFNGDGLDDFAIIFNDGGYYSIDVALSTGAGFTTQRWMTQGIEFFNEYFKWQVGDFNGDGLDDLAFGIDAVGVSFLGVGLSTGAGFNDEFWGYPNAVFAQEDSKWQSGDFNGDGLDDLALLGFNYAGNYAIEVQAAVTIPKDELTGVTPLPTRVDTNPDRIVVNTLIDENDGINVGGVSLREALTVISSGGIITFDPAISGGTIKLTDGELKIDRSLSINGYGSNITVDAQNASRVFNISDGKDNSLNDVLIDGLTITGGDVVNQGYGGGIYNQENLTVSNSTITNNSGVGGGGIYNTSLFNQSIESVVNVINTTITNNFANLGGGIENSKAILNVINSTISNNSAYYGGGGIDNIYGTTNIVSSTISRNLSDSSYGAGGVETGGASRDSSNVNISNSIIAGNINIGDPKNSDISGYYSFTSGGNNLIGNRGDVLDFVNGVNGDIVGFDPLLGPLQDNGGPVFTHALLPGSPAIDAGNNNILPLDILDLNNNGIKGESIPFDSRGIGTNRIVNGRVDIGAFETQLDPLLNLAASAVFPQAI